MGIRWSVWCKFNPRFCVPRCGPCERLLDIDVMHSLVIEFVLTYIQDSFLTFPDVIFFFTSLLYPSLLFCTTLHCTADVSALVISVLDGYNVCIFAYGQTGSGELHTTSITEMIITVLIEFKFPLTNTLLWQYVLSFHLSCIVNTQPCNVWWRQNMDDVRSSQWQGGKHPGPGGAVRAHAGQVIHYTELHHCEPLRGVQWGHQRSASSRGQHREAWSASGRSGEPCAGAHYHGRWNYSGRICSCPLCYSVVTQPDILFVLSSNVLTSSLLFTFLLSACIFKHSFFLKHHFKFAMIIFFPYRTSSTFLHLLILIDPKVRLFFLFSSFLFSSFLPKSTLSSFLSSFLSTILHALSNIFLITFTPLHTRVYSDDKHEWALLSVPYDADRDCH